MKISFIVLTYNRCDALLAVLRSLAAQCGVDHEVLIADDGSSQSQVDMLYKNCPAFRCRVRHVWHPDIGFTAAAARNLGAHHARGDYLVLSHTRCSPNGGFSSTEVVCCLVNGSQRKWWVSRLIFWCNHLRFGGRRACRAIATNCCTCFSGHGLYSGYNRVSSGAAFAVATSVSGEAILWLSMGSMKPLKAGAMKTRISCCALVISVCGEKTDF